MGQKPTIISLIIHKPLSYTKLHHPTALYKEILDSLIPLFHTRNEKDKILDLPSILIFFNNTRNTKTYSPTRQAGKTHIQIVAQLFVIAEWEDNPLSLEDLAEAICIIKLHAIHRF